MDPLGASMLSESLQIIVLGMALMVLYVVIERWW